MTRGTPLALAIALALASLPAVASADAASIQTIFADARDAALEDRDQAAIDGFERLITLGTEDAAVLLDLAIVRARRDELGQARWALRRARALDPRAEDLSHAEAALRQAMAARPEPEALLGEPSLTEAVRGVVTSNELAGLLFGLVVVVALGLLIARRRRSGARAAFHAIAGIAAILAAVCLLLLAHHEGALREGDEYIVIVPQADARVEPDPERPVLATLRDGQIVAIVGRRDAHLLVALPDGRRAYVPSTALRPTFPR